MEKLNALFPAKSAGFLSLPGVLLAAAAALLLATPSQSFSRPGEFGAESYNAPVQHSAFGGSGPMGSFSQRRSLASLSARAYEIDEIVVKGKRFDWGASERLRAQDEIRQWAQQQAIVARACFDARSTRRPAMEHAEVASGAYLRPSSRPSVVGAPGPPAPASVGESFFNGDVSGFSPGEIDARLQPVLDANAEWARQNTEQVSDITGEVARFVATDLAVGGTAGIVAKKAVKLSAREVLAAGAAGAAGAGEGGVVENIAERIVDGITMKIVGDAAYEAGHDVGGPQVVNARNGIMYGIHMNRETQLFQQQFAKELSDHVAREFVRLYQAEKARHRRQMQIVGKGHILYGEAMRSLSRQIYDAILGAISDSDQSDPAATSGSDQSDVGGRRRGGGGGLGTCR